MADETPKVGPPEASRSELSDGNRYAKVSIKAHVFRRLSERFGLDINALDTSQPWTLERVVSWCVLQGVEESIAVKTVEVLRSEAFGLKYSDYCYDDDLRGVTPAWRDEVWHIFASCGVEVGGATVLDVGAGDCREMPLLFAGASRMIAVDVSQTLLDSCHDSRVQRFCCAAESLQGVRDSTIDIYASLRTYQSSLFDTRAAAVQANRVLKPGGVAVISIADGFVEVEGGKRLVVRGLLKPGNHRSVDREAPKRLAEAIKVDLAVAGLTEIAAVQGTSDLFIHARRPGSA